MTPIRVTWRLTMLLLHLILGALIVAYEQVRRRNWYNSEQGKQTIQWWAARACRILAIHVTVTGEISARSKTLFVANHISWIDIIALSAVLQVKFISKESLKYWPLIGWLATSVGTLLIRRGKYFVVTRVVALIKRELKQRHAVLVFPEGTTTDGRQVTAFRSALLQSVSYSDASVQAVALQYHTATGLDRHAPYIGKDNFVFHLLRLSMRDKTQLKLQFTPEFSTQELDRREVARLARDHIISALEDRPYSVPLQAADRQVA